MGFKGVKIILVCFRDGYRKLIVGLRGKNIWSIRVNWNNFIIKKYFPLSQKHYTQTV